MAKTVRVASRKRRSLNKRMRVLDKKTKVVRKNGSRRRIRMLQGGAIFENKTNLSKLWNSLFYRRVQSQYTEFVGQVKSLKDDVSKYEGERCLFVIDMQNDFIDRPYDRKGKGDKHPVADFLTIGNFDVADGAKMLLKDSKFLKYLKTALTSPKYKYVIFSRDYHPVGHNSFNNKWFNEPLLCKGCDDGGNFPAHCVQGFEGSRFVREVEELIRENPSKVKIVFKGIHKEVDSFTAVSKHDIDGNASNILGKCSCDPKSCSSITGGYYLKTQGKSDSGEESDSVTESIEFNTLVQKEQINKFFTQVNYSEILKDIGIIEVCGLAGDYCVRDTAMALAQKFETAKIVVLNDFTRYAFLPFLTIGGLPQHNYKGTKENNNDSLLPVLSNYDKSIIPELFEKGYDNEDKSKGPKLLFKTDTEMNIWSSGDTDAFQKFRQTRAREFLDYVLYIQQDENKTVYKDIVYYLFKDRKLMSREELDFRGDSDGYEKLKTDIVDYANFGFVNYSHFITPLQSMIEDYKNVKNLIIAMDEYER